MEFNECFGERKQEPSTSILVGKFDARDEMYQAAQRLKLTMIKPMQSVFIRSPEEEARSAKQQLDRTIAEIDLAQQRYTGRLESAKKEGSVNNENYSRATMDILSSFSPFERMREEAREAYRKIVKFG